MNLGKNLENSGRLCDKIISNLDSYEIPTTLSGLFHIRPGCKLAYIYYIIRDIGW